MRTMARQTEVDFQAIWPTFSGVLVIDRFQNLGANVGPVAGSGVRHAGGHCPVSGNRQYLTETMSGAIPGK